MDRESELELKFMTIIMSCTSEYYRSPEPRDSLDLKSTITKFQSHVTQHVRCYFKYGTLQ